MDATTGGLTAALVLGALTFKGIDLVKYVVVLLSHRGDVDAKDKTTVETAHAQALNGLITLVLGCAVGVVIVLLFARTDLAADVALGDLPINEMSLASQVALGLAMTAIAGVLFDGKKALDNTDSASKAKITLEAEVDRQEMLKLAQEGQWTS
jgi:hypothetical protein